MGQGLISDDVINQIRDRVDIAEIVGQHVALTRAGQNLKRLVSVPSRKVSLLYGQLFTADFSLFWLRGRRQCVYVSDEIDRGRLSLKLFGILGARWGWMFRNRPGIFQRGRTQLGRLERLNAAAGAWYQRMLTDETAGAQARAYLDGRGIQHDTTAQFQNRLCPAGVGWADQGHAE